MKNVMTSTIPARENNMGNCNPIILAIMIAYMLLNVVVGIAYSRYSANKNNMSAEKKYFIGGRGMSGLLLAMTTMATYLSVSSFISGPGAAGMTYGYAQVWVASVQIPVTFLVLGVLGNKLALVSRKTGAVTIAGYLKARYKSPALVLITSILLVLFFIVQMVAQFKGGATLIQSITGLDYKYSLLIFALIVIIYTSFGGFAAVAITDVIQGFIMCAGTFLLLFFVLKAGGGLSSIDASLQDKLPNVYDNLFAIYTPGTLLSFWILVGFGTLGLPQTAVRAMSFKDTKSLRRAMWISTLTCTFVVVGMHLAGLWAGAITPEKSILTSDYFIPGIVQQIMPVGLAGIFLAAPMAAVMSTTDSLLLSASASIVKDIWKDFIIKDESTWYEKNFSKISIISTAVIGLLVMLITMYPLDIIFFINLFAMGGLECTFFWPLLGGLFWEKGTKHAAICSSIVAVFVYVITQKWIHIAGMGGVVWGLLAGGIAYFATGFVTSRKHPIDQDIKDKCF